MRELATRIKKLQGSAGHNMHVALAPRDAGVGAGRGWQQGRNAWRLEPISPRKARQLRENWRARARRGGRRDPRGDQGPQGRLRAGARGTLADGAVAFHGPGVFADAIGWVADVVESDRAHEPAAQRRRGGWRLPAAGVPRLGKDTVGGCAGRRSTTRASKVGDLLVHKRRRQPDRRGDGGDGDRARTEHFVGTLHGFLLRYVVRPFGGRGNRPRAASNRIVGPLSAFRGDRKRRVDVDDFRYGADCVQVKSKPPI